MWWMHGWRGKKVLAIQTGHYGLAMDVRRARLLHVGRIEKPKPYDEAVAQDNDVVLGLPKARLLLSVEVGGERYACRNGAISRLVESGRLVQRFDIPSLSFATAKGRALAADARLEVIAWPDCVSFLLEVTPRENLKDAAARIELGVSGIPEKGTGGIWSSLDADSDEGVPSRNAPRPPLRAATWRKGETQRQHVAWSPSALSGGSENAKGGDKPRGERTALRVTDLNREDKPVRVSFDPVRNWHHVDLPVARFRIQNNHLDRFGVTVTNDTAATRVCRVNFAIERGFAGISGLTPILRDADGNPTGIPVQVSKNWHRKPGHPQLYEGPWFHGFTMLRVPPRTTWRGELTLCYGWRGTAPAASHGQLCLIGWGTNQLWDQAAIGSWGESICYDPDVCLGRSMIDDLRPLMVWAMSGRPKKWTWTNNVGGGDFLVYVDGRGRRRPLTRMRTAYHAHGPNLTRVTYAGVTADAAIAARITVSTPRCDDLNRAYHRIRYDVLKPTRFRRLAFYQVGADGYNGHQFATLARGNAEQGLVEQRPVKHGGKRYHRRGISCTGRSPWFSLHDAQPRGKGAWANRGLVIRSWRAKLGGEVIRSPFASLYGTHNHVPSLALEISPPPNLAELRPGDYVEADLELLVVPMSSADYYGPNQAFRDHLAKHGNTWRVVHRQAAGNDLRLDVTVGRLVRRYPPVIAAKDDRAEAVVEGGVAWLPVTFTGLSGHAGYTLSVERGGKRTTLDQSVHGRDYWQAERDPATGSFALTYNLPTDAPAAESARVILRRGVVRQRIAPR
jgi:hypothetical protein